MQNPQNYKQVYDAARKLGLLRAATLDASIKHKVAHEALLKMLSHIDNTMGDLAGAFARINDLPTYRAQQIIYGKVMRPNRLPIETGVSQSGNAAQ